MARLLILGPLEARPDDPERARAALTKCVDALTPSDYALLALLTGHPGLHVRREVIKTLWPEEPDWDIHFDRYDLERSSKAAVDEALGNLHAAVGRLRAFLRVVVPGTGRNDVLRTSRQQAHRPGTGSLSFVCPMNLELDIAEARKLEASDPWGALEVVRGPLLRDKDHPFLRDERRRQRETVRTLIQRLLPRASASLLNELTDDIFGYGHLDRTARILKAGQKPAAPDEPLSGELVPRVDVDGLTATAASTLAELLASWVGEPMAVERLSHTVIRLTNPSLWSDVPDIDMRFVVFAEASTHWDVVDVPGVGDECIKTAITESTMDSLREYVESVPNVYFLLARPRDPRRTATALYDLPVHDRFDWWAIDGGQLLRSASWEDESWLPLPYGNRFNLAQFSLLWSAKWVERFFAPLTDPCITRIPALQARVDQVFVPGGTRGVHEAGWEVLTEELPKYAGELPPDVFSQVNFRLGLGLALELICGQLEASAGRLDQIRTYCPEALFGTANLWLFSRIYHEFMQKSARVAAANREFVNQRLLPVAGDEIDTIPRVLLSGLWHVVLSYRMLAADVRLVNSPVVGAGDDHSYYGGGIGYFPWISMTPDQANWMVGQEARGTAEQHLDFLQERQHAAVLGTQHSERDVADIFGLPPHQIHLPETPPLLLLPPEDRFIQYPHMLWGPQARGARLHG